MALVLSVLLIQSCQYGTDSDFSYSPGEGTGGSMARFTVSKNHLFTIDDSFLKVFSLAAPETPEFKKNQFVGERLETIFPLGDNLFFGTSAGMFIYDISNPELPEEVSFYEHVVSCDPVVSDGQFAYVTLNSSNERCWRSVNELHIIDIQDLENPQLVKQYNMTSPRGLTVRNDTLWICDDGLKIFDVKDKQDISLLYHFNGISAYDIILNKQLALVTGETGFAQYRLQNGSIIKISEINILSNE